MADARASKSTPQAPLLDQNQNMWLSKTDTSRSASPTRHSSLPSVSHYFQKSSSTDDQTDLEPSNHVPNLLSVMRPRSIHRIRINQMKPAEPPTVAPITAQTPAADRDMIMNAVSLECIEKSTAEAKDFGASKLFIGHQTVTIREYAKQHILCTVKGASINVYMGGKEIAILFEEKREDRLWVARLESTTKALALLNRFDEIYGSKCIKISREQLVNDYALGLSYPSTANVNDQDALVMAKTNPKEESEWRKYLAGNPDFYLIYPPGEVGAIPVTNSDAIRLDEGELFNDTLIAAYFKYLYNSWSPIQRESVHLFNSHFYDYISAPKSKSQSEEEARLRGYEKVKKWTKNVNIFEKTYVFVPVNENFHWYLVLIYNPGAFVRAVERERNALASDVDEVVDEGMIPGLPPIADHTFDNEHDKAYRSLKRKRPTNEHGQTGPPPPLSHSRAKTTPDSLASIEVVEPDLPIQIPDSYEPDDELSASPATDTDRADVSRFRDDDEADGSMQLADNDMPSLLLQSHSVRLDDDMEMMDEDPLPEAVDSPAPAVIAAQSDDDGYTSTRPTTPIPGARNLDQQRLRILADKAKYINDQEKVRDMGMADCRIFVFDSLNGTRRSVKNIISWYLIHEAKEKLKLDISEQVRQSGRLFYTNVKCPKQDNYCDCGVFLLHYVEVFMSNPEHHLTGMFNNLDIGEKSGDPMFPLSDIPSKRLMMIELMKMWHEQYTSYLNRQKRSETKYDSGDDSSSDLEEVVPISNSPSKRYEAVEPPPAQDDSPERETSPDGSAPYQHDDNDTRYQHDDSDDINAEDGVADDSQLISSNYDYDAEHNAGHEDAIGFLDQEELHDSHGTPKAYDVQTTMDEGVDDNNEATDAPESPIGELSELSKHLRDAAERLADDAFGLPDVEAEEVLDDDDDVADEELESHIVEEELESHIIDQGFESHSVDGFESHIIDEELESHIIGEGFEGHAVAEELESHIIDEGFEGHIIDEGFEGHAVDDESDDHAEETDGGVEEPESSAANDAEIVAETASSHSELSDRETYFEILKPEASNRITLDPALFPSTPLRRSNRHFRSSSGL
ncbi:uncharacterized protein BJ171DRAFT_614050 [Polychytrium aggregatum]|uniref:uncharacterized protein n=1 Tax=Polychytrium aggregatum TaxID=110093 RepID=UPI0022FEA559|nr:uncharacterized protein BJ171DRAFT_614050 [Polychytrium aggregatum]KAI9205942.1 hypothetical protein BJ171DRAFT_614050 [Polychytrium aggregatum]